MTSKVELAEPKVEPADDHLSTQGKKAWKSIVNEYN
jgi:hypothetical protein